MKRESIQVNRNWRIENGPLRKTDVASKELLMDSRTAQRYKEGVRDAFGVKIRIGEPFTYLDDLNDWGWYVFENVNPLTAFERVRKVTKPEHYIQRIICPTKEAALQYVKEHKHGLL